MNLTAICLFVCLSAQGASSQQDECVHGLTVRMFQLDVADLVELPKLVPNQTPNRDFLTPQLKLETKDFQGLVAPMTTRVSGWLLIDQPGEYVLRLISDDGSRLRLDGTSVINHDGRHGSTPKDSALLSLKKGLHPLLIEHFDSGGASSLKFEWKTPTGKSFVVVPTKALRTEADLTRVTSPGVKSVIDHRSPGTGLPVPGVHPSWRVETLRPKGFKPKVGAMCFLRDGRLAFGTFDPLQRDERKLPDIESKAPDAIWALDVKTLELKMIASDVYEPSGMCVVRGELYVSHRRAIDRLKDLDGDGFFETHETVAEGWEGWNYHQFVFGLVHAGGKLYGSLSTTMAPPGWKGMETNSGPGGPMRGGLIEVDLSSNDARVIAGGTRTPNGLGHMNDGTLVYLDNQGTWMPVSVLAEVIPGQFYGHYNWTRLVPKLADRFPKGGHPSVFCDRQRMPPALWLPQNEVVNSPTQPLSLASPIDSTTKTPRYPGQQMLVGELTAGGVRRVALERVNGVLQGALFRFTQGLEAGINRMSWGPGGALYLGGMGAGGNWNWKGTQFGLQRLVPTGKPTFEMATVKARPDGFEIVFTDPVAADALTDLKDFRVHSWTYEPTAAYGGPKKAKRQHRVVGMQMAQDRRSLRIAIEGLRTHSCVHIAFEATSKFGETIWSGETWYTLNRIPVPKKSDPLTKVLKEASPLMPRGNLVAFREKGVTPSRSNLSQDELMKGKGYFELTHDSPQLESLTEMSFGTYELEWWGHVDGRFQGLVGAVSLHRYALNLGTVILFPKDPSAPDSKEREVVPGLPQMMRTGPMKWHTLRVSITPASRDQGRTLGSAFIEVHKNDVFESHDHGLTPSNRPRRIPVTENDRLVIRHLGGKSAPPLRIRNVRFSSFRNGSRPNAKGEWVDILADQKAWVALGGDANYSYKDGVLTGTTQPNTPNTFLTSRETYFNFDMLFEFKVHPELNSGVQIRSAVIGSIAKRDSFLRGYQVEIDPSPRAWTGGIYEERDRGWLHPMFAAPYARRAFRPGQWNRMRVLAEGHRIRTWINGVPAADMTDARSPSGHIGFQVHGVGARKDPLTVQWRKVRLKKF